MIHLQFYGFLKALFETRKQNPMGLDNAMSARLYL